MKILIDGDACPVVREAEELGKKYNIKIILLYDTNHIINSDYSEICIVGAGADAVDFALISKCQKGDIVITQDYGVASMALGKKAFVINSNGKRYTDENIDQLLMERHIAKCARKASNKNHIKGPKKRTRENDFKFCRSFEELIIKASQVE